jgi:hypothetical protein
MKVFTIDPAQQQVTQWSLVRFTPDGIREALGLDPYEGIVSNYLAPGVVVFLHDRGIVQDGAKFWSVAGSTSVQAGKALAIYIDTMSGQIGDLEKPPEIVWMDRLVFAGIDEQLRMVHGHQGPIMVIERTPRFTEAPVEAPAEPAEADPAPIRVWTVYAKSGAFNHGQEEGYRATQYEISAKGHRVVDDPVEAVNLPQLYELMDVNEEYGDTRYTRDPRDDPSVVETWRVR